MSKDMVLTAEFDYTKAWDRSRAEIVRKTQTWDFETIRKLEAVVNDVHKKYWEKKNAQKTENAPFPDLEM